MFVIENYCTDPGILLPFPRLQVPETSRGRAGTYCLLSLSLDSLVATHPNRCCQCVAGRVTRAALMTGAFGSHDTVLCHVISDVGRVRVK